MKIIRWKHFPKRFLEYFRAQSGPFCYKNVNGQCSQVAHLYHEYLGSGIERYGLYYGPVFNPFWEKRPLINHAWVEVGETIHDPTLWCFLRMVRPMLAIVPRDSEAYDHGMNRFRMTMEPAMPAFNRDNIVGCDQPDIVALFGKNKICRDRIFWLANLAPQSQVFRSAARQAAMFRWLQDNGFGAYIPIDNRV